MKKISEIKSEIKEFGYAEIQSGVYLYDQESIINAQNDLDDDDEAKDFDHSIYKFWITTSDGADHEGFDTIKEAIESIK